MQSGCSDGAAAEQALRGVVGSRGFVRFFGILRAASFLTTVRRTDEMKTTEDAEDAEDF